MYEYRAHIRSVYDGDSLRADIDCGFGIWTSNVALRLAGINAPELGHPGGKEARDWLRKLLPAGTEVTIRTYRDATEKYGRLLADIWLDGIQVNQLLMDSGHALPYDGTGPKPEAVA